jgi:hypothetical protein
MWSLELLKWTITSGTSRESENDLFLYVKRTMITLMKRIFIICVSEPKSFENGHPSTVTSIQAMPKWSQFTIAFRSRRLTRTNAKFGCESVLFSARWIAAYVVYTESDRYRRTALHGTETSRSRALVICKNFSIGTNSLTSLKRADHNLIFVVRSLSSGGEI